MVSWLSYDIVYVHVIRCFALRSRSRYICLAGNQVYVLISLFNFLVFQRSVLTKLDTLIDKHEEALSILRVLLSATKGVNDEEIIEDIIPNAIDSVDELEELSSRLNDDDYRKKLVG